MPKTHFSIEYTSYMNSDAWRRKRAAKLRKVGNRCQWHNGSCQGALQVHHWTYKRLGHERMSDLGVFCEYHHKRADLLRKVGKAVGDFLVDWFRRLTP